MSVVPSFRSDARLLRGQEGRVLLLSMRRLSDLVAFCLHYEFEDVIADVTSADRVDVDHREAMEFSRRVYRYTRLTTRSRRLAQAMAPGFSTVRLEGQYDLFLPVFNHAHELFALATIPNWRQHCRRAACFVSEIWAHLLPDYLLELLAEFDHVFVGIRHVAPEVERIVGRPCTYLPLAADVLRFSPHPALPPRVIDVCNIGRRSATTHAALVGLAREGRIFYYYDTVATSPDQKQRTFHVSDASEHRLLLASLLRRTRYLIANRSRINEPEVTKGRDEISGRFYEGAAAGTVMLGEPPAADHFESQFDWPDAVIRLPFDAPEVAKLLAELDANPERVARIRRDNVSNAAQRHDWAWRLRAVFETLGLPPTEGMLAREKRLRELAAAVSEVRGG